MRHPRLVGLAITGAVVLSLGLFAMYNFPRLMEWHWDMTCSEVDLTDHCQRRMRYLGHHWSNFNDLDRAALWYERASKHDDAAAMFHRAWIYEYQYLVAVFLKMEQGTVAIEPVGKPRDNHLAYNQDAELWYRRSAALGFAPAMNNLANMLYTGLTDRPATRDSIAKALYWFRKASSRGNAAAFFNLRMNSWPTHDDSGSTQMLRGPVVWTPKPGTEAQHHDIVLQRTRLLGEVMSKEMQLAVIDAVLNSKSLEIDIGPITSNVPHRFKDVLRDLRFKEVLREFE